MPDGFQRIRMLLTQPSGISMFVTGSGIRMKRCGQYASGCGLVTTGAGPVPGRRGLRRFIVWLLMVAGSPPAVPAMTGAATAAAEHEEEKQPAKQDPYQPSVLCPHGENPPPLGSFILLFCITYAVVPARPWTMYLTDMICIHGIPGSRHWQRGQPAAEYSEEYSGLRRICFTVRVPRRGSGVRTG